MSDMTTLEYYRERLQASRQCRTVDDLLAHWKAVSDAIKSMSEDQHVTESVKLKIEFLER